jgi:uncharacterized membrane protein HdeD (DUF308 family)
MLAVLSKYWWLVLLRGVWAILFGVAALTWPGLTIETLVIVFGAYALVTGAIEVVSVIRLRKEIKGEFLLALSGIASIVLAFLLIAAPEAGALVLVFWLGIWALLMGRFLVVLSLRSRGHTAKAGA